MDDDLGPKIVVPVEFWNLALLALDVARDVASGRDDEQARARLEAFKLANVRFLARHSKPRRRLRLLKW